MSDKINYARKRIEAEMVLAEEKRRRLLMAQRLEAAKNGIIAAKNKRYTEAIAYFDKYFRNLEEAKDTSEQNITPSQFDPKKDLPELLMISGIYWELAKLYDHTKTPEKYRDFLHYLNEYVLFAKGMPYQKVCVEVMRKYISSGRAVHKEELKNSYHLLGGEKCFIATALLDVTAESSLTSLREFRDRVLLSSRLGQAFVRWYYRNGPTLARWVDRLPHAVRFCLGRALDQFAKWSQRLQ